MKWKHPFPARALIARVEKREREALEDPEIMYETIPRVSEGTFRGYETISGVFECPNGEQMARSESPNALTGDQMAHSESPRPKMVTGWHVRSLRMP